MAGQALAHSWGPSGCERGLPLLTCVELATQLCGPIHPPQAAMAALPVILLCGCTSESWGAG